jgi:redox-sensitive bicupin YhaK (pirin superfamily)
MSLRRIVHHSATEREETGQGFTVNRVLDNAQAPFMDPFLMVDAFTLTEPYFAPHPHAGFAPVSYMFPESEIGLLNKDSIGTRNRVAPGSMHWMTSGRGIVHEEVPEQRGRAARGLQIFVNLPARLKFMEPGYVHVEAGAVPVLEKNGAIIRAALGASNGIVSPGHPPYPVRLIDVTLPPGVLFEQELDSVENAFVYVFEGDCRLEGANGGAALERFDVAGTAPGGTMLRLLGGHETARLVVFAGQPINEPVMAYGPFIMSSRDDLIRVMNDYRMGKMGKVEKSIFGPDGRPLPET